MRRTRLKSVLSSRWSGSYKRRLDEEVEEEEEEAQEEEEGAPGETAAGELHGVEKAGGDDPETRFAASLVEGAGGNMAREITP